MIRVVLQGRTGNNLFQYAAARWLGDRHGTGVVLDGAWLRPRNWRQAKQLRRLGLRAELRRPLPWLSAALRVAAGRHLWEFGGRRVHRESLVDQAFDPAFRDLPDGTLLLGYFQSPLYFDGLRERLREELALDALPLDRCSRELAAGLRATESVSLHVRRGDFLNYPDFRVCDDSYYERAVAWMKARLGRPVFWVFSDDPGWCAERFRGPEFRLCDAPQSAHDPFNDLRLMSLARHHIIVNSSYSWWAAWLGWAPGREVVMPQAWHLGSCRIPVEEKAEDGWVILHGNDPAVLPRVVRKAVSAVGTGHANRSIS